MLAGRKAEAAVAINGRIMMSPDKQGEEAQRTSELASKRRGTKGQASRSYSNETEHDVWL